MTCYALIALRRPLRGIVPHRCAPSACRTTAARLSSGLTDRHLLHLSTHCNHLRHACRARLTCHTATGTPPHQRRFRSRQHSGRHIIVRLQHRTRFFQIAALRAWRVFISLDCPTHGVIATVSGTRPGKTGYIALSAGCEFANLHGAIPVRATTRDGYDIPCGSCHGSDTVPDTVSYVRCHIPRCRQ